MSNPLKTVKTGRGARAVKTVLPHRMNLPDNLLMGWHIHMKNWAENREKGGSNPPPLAVYPEKVKISGRFRDCFGECLRT